VTRPANQADLGQLLWGERVDVLVLLRLGRVIGLSHPVQPGEVILSPGSAGTGSAGMNRFRSE
jgi:hypothetical protein